ncbi:MAG: hypothetical protein M3Y43_12305 [Pseudomonadota bacterium]|nr:hypothetical protein [Pseudomonadota bacterium]MDQ2705940.1 hypothetical protein [Pseudomonadota bacterium]
MKRLPSLTASLLAAIALCACSSTQDVLEPSAIAASPPAPGALQTENQDRAVPVRATSTDATAALNPGIAARTRLRFDPIVGATVEAATPLTERLAERARARGIRLAGNTDPSTTHVLKGYFSTLTEGGQTTVIYVWDVYDAAGNRLHRINGQQKAGKGEGWPAVSSAAMQAIADSTVDELASWLASGTG